jgi:signal transduction histidine kinase
MRALLVMLLTQAIATSYRYTRFQQHNMQLAHDLQEVNRDLEEKVIARTNDLNASNAQLIALTNQRSQLMANIAHDMGSPLTGIQLSLHMLTEDSLNPQEKQDMFGVSITSINYVKQLVDDLFRLAKLESRQLEFDWEYTSVVALYTDVTDYFNQLMQTRGRTLVSTHSAPDGCASDIKVRIDRRQLYRVLQNLIDNALKYSTDPQSAIVLRSTVCQSHVAATTCYEWRVEVIDYGVGIATENLPLIFERFYTRSSGLQTGSGLGLAICKEIIEYHGGVIGVQSVQEQGSTFFFVLPIID